MPTEFTTSVGRILWGNPAKAQDKTHGDGPMKGQKILKDGQPVKVWSFGVAFPKAEFDHYIRPYLNQEASIGFPQGTPSTFKWKFKDGDTELDGQNKPLRDKEGYAGCYILAFSTEAFAPPIYKFNPQTGGYDQLTPEQIKTGDFVAVSVRAVVNVSTDPRKSSSLYVNPAAVELVGYGKEIISAAAVDPRQAFGGQQRALPPGASAAPVLSSGGVGMPGTAPMPGQPAPMAPPPPVPVTSGYPVPQPPQPAPMPGQMPGYPQPVAPPPAPGFAQGNGYPMPDQPAPMAPPPPMPAAPPAPARPVDPNHIANPGTPHEQWWNGTAWVPAPQQPMPGMMPPR